MFYGGIFGFGVSIIDTVMDARIEGLSFLDEMVQHRSMMIYRSVFILCGPTDQRAVLAGTLRVPARSGRQIRWELSCACGGSILLGLGENNGLNERVHRSRMTCQ